MSHLSIPSSSSQGTGHEMSHWELARQKAGKHIAKKFPGTVTVIDPNSPYRAAKGFFPLFLAAMYYGLPKDVGAPPNPKPQITFLTSIDKQPEEGVPEEDAPVIPINQNLPISGANNPPNHQNFSSFPLDEAKHFLDTLRKAGVLVSLVEALKQDPNNVSTFLLNQVQGFSGVKLPDLPVVKLIKGFLSSKAVAIGAVFLWNPIALVQDIMAVFSYVKTLKKLSQNELFTQLTTDPKLGEFLLINNSENLRALGDILESLEPDCQISIHNPFHSFFDALSKAQAIYRTNQDIATALNPLIEFVGSPLWAPIRNKLIPHGLPETRLKVRKDAISSLSQLPCKEKDPIDVARFLREGYKGKKYLFQAIPIPAYKGLTNWSGLKLTSQKNASDPNLTFCAFENMYFEDFDFSHTTFVNCSFKDVIFVNCKFGEAQVEGSLQLHGTYGFPLFPTPSLGPLTVPSLPTQQPSSAPAQQLPPSSPPVSWWTWAAEQGSKAAKLAKQIYSQLPPPPSFFFPSDISEQILKEARNELLQLKEQLKRLEESGVQSREEMREMALKIQNLEKGIRVFEEFRAETLAIQKELKDLSPIGKQFYHDFYQTLLCNIVSLQACNNDIGLFYTDVGSLSWFYFQKPENLFKSELPLFLAQKGQNALGLILKAIPLIGNTIEVAENAVTLPVKLMLNTRLATKEKEILCPLAKKFTSIGVFKIEDLCEVIARKVALSYQNCNLKILSEEGLHTLVICGVRRVIMGMLDHKDREPKSCYEYASQCVAYTRTQSFSQNSRLDIPNFFDLNFFKSPLAMAPEYAEEVLCEDDFFAKAGVMIEEKVVEDVQNKLVGYAQFSEEAWQFCTKSPSPYNPDNQPSSAKPTVPPFTTEELPTAPLGPEERERLKKLEDEIEQLKKGKEGQVLLEVKVKQLEKTVEDQALVIKGQAQLIKEQADSLKKVNGVFEKYSARSRDEEDISCNMKLLDQSIHSQYPKPEIEKSSVPNGKLTPQTLKNRTPKGSPPVSKFWKPSR